MIVFDLLHIILILIFFKFFPFKTCKSYSFFYLDKVCLWMRSLHPSCRQEQAFGFSVDSVCCSNLRQYPTKTLHINMGFWKTSARAPYMTFYTRNTEQGKCRLTNEYLFFLFLLAVGIMKKYFFFIKTNYSSRYSFIACNSRYA